MLHTNMTESHFQEARGLFLFSEMAEEPFRALMHGSYVQNFPPHIDLITEGDPSGFLHIVVSGSVELFSRWNERETTMAVVHPVSTFILAATIKDAPYLMSARTLEKSRIVLIPSQNVRAAFETDTRFARAIVTELAQCYRSVIKSTKDLKLRNSLEQLANFLLRLQRQKGGAETFTLPMEKRRLASKLGMSAENLSRAFKALRPYGVVVQGTVITIASHADLVQFAKPSPLIDDHQS